MCYCSLCYDNKHALTKKPIFYCIKAFYKDFSNYTPFFKNLPLIFEIYPSKFWKRGIVPL